MGLCTMHSLLQIQNAGKQVCDQNGVRTMHGYEIRLSSVYNQNAMGMRSERHGYACMAMHVVRNTVIGSCMGMCNKLRESR